MKIDVIYKREGQVDRTIEALVFYKNEEPKEGRTKGRYPTVWLIIKNSTTTGISPDEIDTGIDKITMPPRKDMTAKDMRILRILTQNCGFLRLELKG